MQGNDRRDSEAMFRLISEQSLLGIVIIQDNRIEYANEAWATITGYTPEEMYSWEPKDFLKRVHPDDRAHMLEQAIKKQSGEKDVHTRYDWRLIAKNGQIKWIGMYSRSIPYRKRTADLATMVDITESKRNTAALRESEEKYRTLIENATDAIYIAQDNTIKFPNPAAIDMMGYTEEELMAIPFLQLVHPEDREKVADRYQRRLRGETLPQKYAFRAVTRAGDTLWVQLNTALIEWEGRPATLNIIRDITQQKKTEEKLIQAQKMKSIGTLAGGIAHDFNNLLMGILGRISLMISEIKDDHPHYEHCKGIEAYVKQATDLTKQLLGYARGGKYETKPTNLNDCLKQSARLFGRTRKEIRIEKKFDPELWTVEADRGQIEQVLLNLYLNSWQAMPNGGEIYLHSENTVMAEEDVAPHQASPGRYVKISVTDSGVGMDADTRARIFDPFFTTRKMGRGTGLGLASAYGIIRNHNGMITVYSEKGRGTSFNIYLPASDKAVASLDKLSNPVSKGDGTILLVDDEKLVLDVGKKMLEKIGYKVICAGNGQAAIDIVTGGKVKIDLVILDMIMPDMGGDVVFEKIKKIDDTLKVLLSSGYSLNGQASQILNRGCEGFIQKPFSLHALSQKIRDILSMTRKD